MESEATPTTRVQTTFEALRAEIISGELKPGARLAIEHLRNRHAVGSSTVREALSLLIADALVESEDQRGFTVKPMSIEDLRDLSALRILIESESLRRSIADGDDEWEANLVAAFHLLAKAQGRLDDGADNAVAEWERRNRAFHAALTAGSESPWRRQILVTLQRHTERYRRAALVDTTVPRDVHDEHGQLLEAALKRDADRACRLLAEHIENTTAVLVSLMSDDQPRSDRVGGR